MTGDIELSVLGEDRKGKKYVKRVKVDHVFLTLIAQVLDVVKKHNNKYNWDINTKYGYSPYVDYRDEIPPLAISKSTSVFPNCGDNLVNVLEAEYKISGRTFKLFKK